MQTSPSLTPRTQSRTNDAYDRLHADILSNQLPPGYQATEPEIAARLGMSRTPVREALIKLEAEGLVELIPRHGARILPISTRDMEEIYEVLSVLEPQAAAALARRKLPPESLGPLRQTVTDMRAALKDGDLDRWAAADDAFHRTLLALHANRRMMNVASVLYDQAHRARMVTLRLRDLPEQSTKDHEDILAALERGDADAAQQVFAQHRGRAARELLSILEKLGLKYL